MNQIQEAVAVLNNGGIIAYPTEAVFGLGCDPLNEKAVAQLLKLKNRAVEKGLILIGASWEQIQDYIDIKKIPEIRLKEILKTWPGPVTWVFPAATFAPKWITGKHATIAIRLTNHPIAKSICESFGKPLVSTSANLDGQFPARTALEVEKIFADKIALVVNGDVGGLDKPTEIRDAISGKVLREA